ncbi:MAG: MerR family transcriptional regulator [Bdellovibrionales bacterium]|nr:MerR family transcriptional regulator [Bdellovibrionales bacterium]
MYPINVVEKETSISKYLLRMWERRYTFPRPERDQKGERIYTDADVEKLKLVKKLMEEGYRPSKIIDQGLPELRVLSKSFDHSKDKDNSEYVVVLLTRPELETEVIEALKDYHIKKTFTVHNQADINNLTM